MTADAAHSQEPWTILRLLEWTRAFFTSKGIDDARLEAELLLAHALGIERIRLYAEHDRVVGEPQLSAFRDLVRRRAQRVPTQYLLGKAWFRNLELEVTPEVLCPRPETELLVDEALELLSPKRRAAWRFERGEFIDQREQAPELIETDTRPPPPAEPRVLDLCTGSGCIALAIAGECPAARVVATDVSAAALEVARRNAEHCGLAERVAFAEGDLYAALDGLPEAERSGFHLVTANPPYVSEGEVAELMPEVRDHEPRQALVSGPTGFELIDRILDGAAARLADGGHVLMEIGYRQADALRQRAERRTDLALESVRRDLGGHERVVRLVRT